VVVLVVEVVVDPTTEGTVKVEEPDARDWTVVVVAEGLAPGAEVTVVGGGATTVSEGGTELPADGATVVEGADVVVTGDSTVKLSAVDEEMPANELPAESTNAPASIVT